MTRARGSRSSANRPTEPSPRRARARAARAPAAEVASYDAWPSTTHAPALAFAPCRRRAERARSARAHARGARARAAAVAVAVDVGRGRRRGRERRVRVPGRAEQREPRLVRERAQRAQQRVARRALDAVVHDHARAARGRGRARGFAAAAAAARQRVASAASCASTLSSRHSPPSERALPHPAPSTPFSCVAWIAWMSASASAFRFEASAPNGMSYTAPSTPTSILHGTYHETLSRPSSLKAHHAKRTSEKRAISGLIQRHTGSLGSYT